MRTDVLVIGGGYAGVMAALRAARELQGSGQRVTLVSESAVLTERIRLHQRIAEGRETAVPLARWLGAAGVELRVARVKRIDAAAHEVVMCERASEVRLGYGVLVLAVGSRTDRDAVPGAREHASVLEPWTADALRARVVELAARGGRVAVVGGGLTGIEIASELRAAHAGLEVTLLSRGALGEGSTAASSERYRAGLERLGVVVREGHVLSVESGALRLADGSAHGFDLCIWAAGMVAPALARESGLPIDARGRVRTDAMLRALGVDDVIVAGDCAAPEGTLGSPVVGGCKSAMPLGVRAGENAAAIRLGRVPRAFGWRHPGYCTSVGRDDALIQLVDASAAGTRAITGWAATAIKETICRFTVWAIDLERAGLRYRWLPAPRSAPRLAPDARTSQVSAR